MFGVQQSMNAVVQIQLVCTGLAGVSADINVCPVIDGLSVLPSQVYVGGSTSLVLAARDPDNGPSPLSATWTASSGTLTNMSTTGATFTCTEPGPVDVGVSVSDGTPDPSCGDSIKVTVICTPVPSAELAKHSPARKGAV
jgi:hypothetical protein